MTANASHYPKGIATWHIPEEMDDEEFLARDSFGCFFVVASKDLGPVNRLTFRPVFWDNDWGGDDIKEFEKILSEKLKIKARRIEKVVRGKDGLVKQYKT
ncbi:hypothetical protein BT69DRAFT_1352714 [Atractiella rhizophila]|nr:hypothetical protein BT69DRAFT_1352714 [Atractiella rhizophila]